MTIEPTPNNLTPSEPTPAQTEGPVVTFRPEPQVWGGGATFGFGLAIFAIYFIVQFLAVIPFAIASVLDNPTFDLFELLNDIASGTAISVSIFASAVAGILFIILFIRIRKRAGIAQYLGLKTISGKTVLLSVAAVGAALGLSIAVSMLSGRSEDGGFMENAYRNSTHPELLWIAAVVFAPAFEEAFFRGFLFAGFSQSRLGFIGTIILTAFLWSVLHVQYGLYGISTIFLMGIILGVMRWKTGSLWSPLIIHGLWNLAAMIELALTV